MDYTATFAAIGSASDSLAALSLLRGVTMPAIAAASCARRGGSSSTAAVSRAGVAASNSLASMANAIVARAASDLAAAVAGERPPDTSLPTSVATLNAAMSRDGQSVQSGGVSLRWLPASRAFGQVAAALRHHDAFGRNADTAFPETIQASLAGGAMGLRSFFPVANPSDPSWPGGSNLSLSVPLVDANQNPLRSPGGQLLQNGGFDAWSGGLPASWHAGAWPDAISQGTQVDSGAASLQFAGDGYSLPAIHQQFGSDAPYRPPGGSLLAFGLFARLAGQPTSGTLEVALLDGLGATLTGADGKPCSVRFDLSRGLGSWGYGLWGEGLWGSEDGGGAWGARPWGSVPWGAQIGGPFVPLTGIFSVPAAPAIRLAIRLASPLSAGSALILDRAAAAVPATLYGGGPSVAFFSADPAPAAGYTASLAVGNDLGSRFAWGAERLFGMRALNQALPTSVAPTVSSDLGTIDIPGIPGGSAGTAPTTRLFGPDSIGGGGGSLVVIGGPSGLSPVTFP